MLEIFLYFQMLRSGVLNPTGLRSHGVVLFRAMATKLKDYVSHYEILEVNGECTKVSNLDFGEEGF